MTVRRPLCVLTCALAAVAAGCGEDEPARGGAVGAELADLVVRVDRDGPRGAREPRELRVRCSSEEDSPACAAAARLEPPDFAPVPRLSSCTQLYGGPETARISGRLRGVAVSARYRRNDGCEIARWERVSALLDEVR